MVLIQYALKLWMLITNPGVLKEGYRVEFAYDSIDVVSPFVADESNGITNAVLGGAC